MKFEVNKVVTVKLDERDRKMLENATDIIESIILTMVDEHLGFIVGDGVEAYAYDVGYLKRLHQDLDNLLYAEELVEKVER